MGYWDRELSGLAALGIELSEGQRRLLEQGGEGLALRVLPDPLHFQCCAMPYLNIEEELSLFAAPMVVHAPDDLAPYEGSTVAEVAESWWGEDWRRWPTVLGEIEDVGEGIWGAAELFAVRAWSVQEADEARQARFTRASRKWLGATDYEPLALIHHDFASGIDCGDEPCREDCKHAGEEDHECLSEDDVDNVYFWKAMWDLEDAGYVDPEDRMVLRRVPPVPPFETVLDDPDDLAYFTRLKRRSRQSAVNALTGIRRELRTAYMRQEETFEPWY